jgi:hypothetical protein
MSKWKTIEDKGQGSWMSVWTADVKKGGNLRTVITPFALFPLLFTFCATTWDVRDDVYLSRYFEQCVHSLTICHNNCLSSYLVLVIDRRCQSLSSFLRHNPKHCSPNVQLITQLHPQSQPPQSTSPIPASAAGDEAAAPTPLLKASATPQALSMASPPPLAPVVVLDAIVFAMSPTPLAVSVMVVMTSATFWDAPAAPSLSRSIDSDVGGVVIGVKWGDGDGWVGSRKLKILRDWLLFGSEVSDYRGFYLDDTLQSITRVTLPEFRRHQPRPTKVSRLVDKATSAPSFTNISIQSSEQYVTEISTSTEHCPWLGLIETSTVPLSHWKRPWKI